MINKFELIKYGLVSILILVLVLSFGFYAKANPSFFIRNGNGATTTPLGYLSPGTGTTTISAFDLGRSGNQGADSAILALQFTGSTTPSAGSLVATTTYNIAIEYSQDSVDWYSDMYSAFGTTTVSQNISAPLVRAITLGTQTTLGRVVSSTTPTKILINVPSPTRYVRAFVTIPTGSTNGSVWGEFIAKRQSGN